jgi:hypothetical protein
VSQPTTQHHRRALRPSLCELWVYNHLRIPILHPPCYHYVTSGLYLRRMVILNYFFLLQSPIHSNTHSFAHSLIFSVFFYFYYLIFTRSIFLFLSLPSLLFIFYSPFLPMLTKGSFHLKLFINARSLYSPSILIIYFLLHSFSSFFYSSCVDLRKPTASK